MEFRVSVPGRTACSVAVRRIGTPVPTPAVRFAGEDQDGASVAWMRIGGGAGRDRFGAFGSRSGSGSDSGSGSGPGSGSGSGLGDGARSGSGSRGGNPSDRATRSGRGAGGDDRDSTDSGGQVGGRAHFGDGARSGGREHVGGREQISGRGPAAGCSDIFGEPVRSGSGIGSMLRADPLDDGVGVPLTWCDWEPSLLLDIPESWPPGLYVARFSVEAPLLSMVALRGRSAYVPFVVRAPLAAGFPTLTILPFAAYAAANPWPTAEVRRARAVSLDRPFAGDGLPPAFAADAAFVQALVDTDFATSLDLHAGLVDPGAYRRVRFRPDVWSPRMREALERASLRGTEVVGLEQVPPPSVGFAAGPDGRPDRVLVRC
ncbi:N,N-dimethylformamidase beta subunit family domain-containing protein [Catenulispora yoronensis]